MTPADEPRAGGRRSNLPAFGLLAGIAISVLALWWALKDVDFAELGARLASADWRWVTLGVLLMTAGLVCRALRWRLFLRPLAPVGVLDVNAFGMIGQAMNALLPAKAGEVARVGLVANKYHVPFGAVLSIVAADRLLDLAMLAVLALALPLYFPLPEVITRAIELTAFVAAAGFVVLVVVVRRPDGGQWIGNLVARVTAPVLRARAAGLGEWVTAFIDSFRAGAVHLGDPRRLVVGVLWTVVAWTCVTLYGMCALLAIGEFEHLPLSAGLVLTILVNLSAAAPSAPGAWGVYHETAKLGLTLMQVDQTGAASFAVLAHAMWYLPVILLGLVSLAYEGLSLGQVRRLAEH
jgi:uncharacterized protein (TIRG00374 family)